MDKVKCIALMALTEFVPGLGMLHIDPASSDEKVSRPLIPVSIVARLIKDGRVALIDGDAPPSTTVVVDAPLAGLGEPIQIDGGADADGDPIPPVAQSLFAMTHQGFGNYLIEGPGLAPDTIIKGKRDAEAFLKLAEESHAEAEPAPTAPDGDQDAPV